jgi:formylglycine-generating enzyme required for sulfatase activity
MSEFNILFWLLIVMLAGIVFAIENGVAARHKRVVASSAVASLAAAVFLMFLEEERWKFTYEQPDAVAKGKGGGGKADTEEGDGGGGPAPIDAGNKKSKSAMITSDAPTRPSGPISDCDVCPSMIVVPRGSLRMGSLPIEEGHRPEEGPARSIHIPRDFAVSRFEITRDEFSAFVKATGHTPPATCTINGKLSKTHNWLKPGFEQGGRHAVVCITLEDARAYVAWLSTKSKKSYRLLSEAEWEYVARAGSTSAFYHGDKMTSAQANFGRSRDGTIQGGFVGSNRFGLFDTFGNAWEMVADCWSPSLERKPEDGRAETGGACTESVIRGGAFDSPLPLVRSAARASMTVGAAVNNVGLRVARTWDPKELKDFEKKKEAQAAQTAKEMKKPAN